MPSETIYLAPGDTLSVPPGVFTRIEFLSISDDTLRGVLTPSSTTNTHITGVEGMYFVAFLNTTPGQEV